MKIKGTLRHVDLEGGLWQLIADDGRHFQLASAPKGHGDGARVEVDGELKQQGMSIGMSAPMLEAKSVRSLS